MSRVERVLETRITWGATPSSPRIEGAEDSRSPDRLTAVGVFLRGGYGVYRIGVFGGATFSALDGGAGIPLGVVADARALSLGVTSLEQF